MEKKERRAVRRRKWKRYLAESGSLVLAYPARMFGLVDAKPIELGPIINISLGGLMAQYISSKERERPCSELSISLHRYGIQVERIPCETLADFEVARLPDGKTIRNRSVKFGKLTSYQTFRLEEFIKKHSAGCLLDRRSGRDRRQKKDPRYTNPKEKDFKNRRKRKDRRKA